MSKPLVILNPGHHLPEDPGAVGNGLREADITLKLANLINNKSNQYGFDTVIVHQYKLSDIVNNANQYKDAVLFMSIHCNSANNPTATGFESYVYPGDTNSKKIQEVIHGKVVSFLNYYGFPNRGMKEANFAVLRETTIPAILTENLFISNPKDAGKLADDKFLEKLADIYCQAISEALGTKKKDNIPEWARNAVEWAYNQKLILNKEGSNDFYRFIVIIYNYHNKFIQK